MIIIPVIDLLNGLAVHARQGERNSYQPVDSPLCRDPRPSAVIAGYLSLFPFDKFYIADLNAIMKNGDNRRLIMELVKEYPEFDFWIDAGEQSNEFHSLEQIYPVLGTETGIGIIDLEQWSYPDKIILSLDFMNGNLIGDPDILSHDEFWPDKVIIMSIDKVGSRSGPDTDLISNVQSRVSGREIYVAGGVRQISDLSILAGTGVNGVLLASALHDQTLGMSDIFTCTFQAKKTPV